MLARYMEIVLVKISKNWILPIRIPLYSVVIFPGLWSKICRFLRKMVKNRQITANKILFNVVAKRLRCG